MSENLILLLSFYTSNEEKAKIVKDWKTKRNLTFWRIISFASSKVWGLDTVQPIAGDFEIHWPIKSSDKARRDDPCGSQVSPSVRVFTMLTVSGARGELSSMGRAEHN